MNIWPWVLLKQSREQVISTEYLHRVRQQDRSRIASKLTVVGVLREVAYKSFNMLDLDLQSLLSPGRSR